MTDFKKEKRNLLSQFCYTGLLVLGLFLWTAISVQAQQRLTVKGKVTDAQTGEAIPGVNVVEKGTTNGTITNFNGEYQLTAPAVPPLRHAHALACLTIPARTGLSIT